MIEFREILKIEQSIKLKIDRIATLRVRAEYFSILGRLKVSVMTISVFRIHLLGPTFIRIINNNN